MAPIDTLVRDTELTDAEFFVVAARMVDRGLTRDPLATECWYFGKPLAAHKGHELVTKRARQWDMNENKLVARIDAEERRRAGY